MRVIWTKEASFAMCKAHERIWVTRSTEEQYSEDCLVPKFKKVSGLMIRKVFRGIEKSSLVFWDSKNQGKNYRTIPPHTHSSLPLSFLAYTLSHAKQLLLSSSFYGRQGTRPCGCSDNPIQRLHGLSALQAFLTGQLSSPKLYQSYLVTMKDHLFAANQNGQPQTVEGTSKLIVQIWNEISAQESRRLIENMLERVEVVIAACCGHTKY